MSDVGQKHHADESAPEVVARSKDVVATAAEELKDYERWLKDFVASEEQSRKRHARALLARKGWRDSDGDGVLDQGGRPLALQLNFPGPSAIRALIAPMVQEQWRRIGVKVDLLRLDGPVWGERRGKGEFDIDFSSAVMDPSPPGWCRAGAAPAGTAATWRSTAIPRSTR